LFKSLALLFILSLYALVPYAQNDYNCGHPQFKKLIVIARKDSITDSDILVAVKLVKELEKTKCSDYTGKKNGQDSVIATRTGLFGEICLKKNDHKAVDEYIKYMKREHGSAEEQLSFYFEKIFVKRSADALALIGNNTDLLNSLEWGFVNNEHFTSKNLGTKFFEIIPTAKELYPQYKKQIDYLIKEITEEEKDIENSKNKKSG
jgi:hypothetical protein